MKNKVKQRIKNQQGTGAIMVFVGLGALLITWGIFAGITGIIQSGHQKRMVGRTKSIEHIMISRNPKPKAPEVNRQQSGYSVSY